MTNQEKTSLEKLIAVGKIQEAIDQLLAMDMSQSRKKEVLSISAKYSELKRKSSAGVLSSEQKDLAGSRITAALLDFINDTDAGTTTQENPAPDTPPSKSRLWEYITYIAVIMTILGGLAEVLGFINIIPPGKENPAPLQLTVFVTDTKGNPALVGEGNLNIPLGNRALNEIVGANGRTNFPDITADNKGDTIRIGLDAGGWEIVGNNTFVFSGEPITLKVKRDDSLGTIKGVVKSRDGQKFLEGARIHINADTVIMTDEFGRFRIVLPEEMRVKKETDGYELTVSKEGYRTRTESYYLNSSDAEIRLIKK